MRNQSYIEYDAVSKSISIPHSLLAIPIFSGSEQLIIRHIMYLSHKYEKNGGCTLTNINLAKKHQVSVDTISKAISKAVRLGFLIKRTDIIEKHTQKNGSIAVAQYRRLLMETPKLWEMIGEKWAESYYKGDEDAEKIMKWVKKEFKTFPTSDDYGAWVCNFVTNLQKDFDWNDLFSDKDFPSDEIENITDLRNRINKLQTSILSKRKANTPSKEKSLDMFKKKSRAITLTILYSLNKLLTTTPFKIKQKNPPRLPTTPKSKTKIIPKVKKKLFPEKTITGPEFTLIENLYKHSAKEHPKYHKGRNRKEEIKKGTPWILKCCKQHNVEDIQKVIDYANSGDCWYHLKTGKNLYDKCGDILDFIEKDKRHSKQSKKTFSANTSEYLRNATPLKVKEHSLEESGV